MIKKTSDGYCPSNRKGHIYKSQKSTEFSKRVYKYKCIKCGWVRIRKEKTVFRR